MCRKITVFLYFFLLPLVLLAQTDPGDPCVDYDPGDNNCPLDTHVWIFAIVVIALCVIYMHFLQKRKAGIKNR